MQRLHTRWRYTVALSAVMLAAIAAPAWAQSGAEFFNGKTVNYIVATDPGGGYDTNGRLLAQFMEKHLPGSTFVVRNMPGAGHMIGANFIHASEPDGLTIGTFNTGLLYSQLVEDEGLRFDLRDMDWIGNIAADPRVIMVTTDSDVEELSDLIDRETPVRFAGGGPGSANTVETLLLAGSAGLDVELITGYNGNAAELALRRGEVQGVLNPRSSREIFVKDGHGRFIVQFGGEQTDVPQARDLLTDPVALQAVTLIEVQGEIARLTAAPPGVPEDRLAALREAYDAATKDPEFLERAAALSLPVEPRIGEDVATAIDRALDQPPEVVELLRQALVN